MARKVKVDMTDVDVFVRCEEGQHIAVLKEIEEKESSTGNDMLQGVFEVIKGSSTGAQVYENFPLSKKGLWKLKSYLDAVGMKSEGKLSLDLDKLLGKKLIIEVIHEEYNGSTRAKIDGYKKLQAAKDSEPDEDDEEDEEDEPPKKASKKSKKAPDEDDEDEDDEPTKKSKKDKKTSKKSKKQQADDDDDEWEDD